jgi:adenosine deaminase
VHAGESSGPEGVRDVINLLNADRIDHGVRAIEDDALVAELVERQIPLGICPTSNLTLGLYASIAQHPVDALRQRGVAVSINTDDPGFLDNDLVGEYQRCIEAFGWTADVVRDVARTSIESSFARDDIKHQLLHDLINWPPTVPPTPWVAE